MARFPLRYAFSLSEPFPPAFATAAAAEDAIAAACSFFRLSTAALTLAIACGVGLNIKLFFRSRGGGGIHGGDDADGGSAAGASAVRSGLSALGTYSYGGFFDDDDRLLCPARVAKHAGKKKTWSP